MWIVFYIATIASLSALGLAPNVVPETEDDDSDAWRRRSSGSRRSRRHAFIIMKSHWRAALCCWRQTAARLTRAPATLRLKLRLRNQEQRPYRRSLQRCPRVAAEQAVAKRCSPARSLSDWPRVVIAQDEARRFAPVEW